MRIAILTLLLSTTLSLKLKPLFVDYSTIAGKIPFLNYTASQKQTLADGVVELMNVYVNADSKREHYKEDITSSLYVLQAAASTLSDSQLHGFISKLFLRLRDFQYSTSNLAQIITCRLLMLVTALLIQSSSNLSKLPILLITQKLS